MKRKLNWKQRAAAASAFVVLAAGSAMADVPAGYTTMLTGLTTDAGGFIEDVYLAVGGIAVIGVLGALAISGLKKGKSAL